MLHKRIFDDASTQLFQRSVAARSLWDSLQWVAALMSRGGTPTDPFTDGTANSIRSTDSTTSFILMQTLGILDRFRQIMEETPPLRDHKQRFGNLAFRTWHERAMIYLQDRVRTQFPNTLTTEQKEELIHYFIHSFGSPIRMDFGTGHELSFLAFIGALKDCQLLVDTKLEPYDIQLVWFQYYILIQALIKWYTLEPAGSHGVWGLDDHFHLIYIWGASQWLKTETSSSGSFMKPAMTVPKPKHLLEGSWQEEYKNRNFFCNGLSFIHSVKKGPFHEHSPILYDILTKVPSWTKIKQGLLKMYTAEVLQKFPVVQHFWFGDCFYPWRDAAGNSLPILQEAETDTTTTTTTTTPSTTLPTPTDNNILWQRDMSRTQRTRISRPTAQQRISNNKLTR